MKKPLIKDEDKAIKGRKRFFEFEFFYLFL